MPPTAPQLLIVEGKDDQYAVEKLLDRCNLAKTFHIESKGGFPQLRESIFAELNAAQRRVLGIVADANDDLATRWQSIRDALADADCTAVPQHAIPTGALFPGPRSTRVGIWLMPDNQHVGELEDFIAKLVPPNDPLWTLAKDYIDEIPSALQKFADNKRTRAHVHAWLATRDAPRPMGSAITAGDLDHNAPAAKSLVAWLRQLFSLQPAIKSSPDADTDT